MEKTASHPLAKAIISKAESCGFHIPSAKGQLMEPGFGCLAEVDGRLVAVGSLEWVFERVEGKKNQVDLTCLEHALIQELSKENPSLNKSETMVYVGREGEGVIGAIAISDALRHDAKVTISRYISSVSGLFFFKHIFVQHIYACYFYGYNARMIILWLSSRQQF